MYRERSKSLDISIGEYRVTIVGKDAIEQYAKTESLDNLSKEVWSVCKKKRVKLDNAYASYTMSIGCKLHLKEEIPVDPESQEFAVVLASWSSKKQNVSSQKQVFLFGTFKIQCRSYCNTHKGNRI